MALNDFFFFLFFLKAWFSIGPDESWTTLYDPFLNSVCEWIVFNVQIKEEPYPSNYL